MSLKSEELEIFERFFFCSAHEHPGLFILSRAIVYKKQRFPEPGEMAQPANSSLCEHTDLGLDPRHPCKKLGTVEDTLILVLGRWRQRWLTGWAVSTIEFSKRSRFKTQGGE